MPNTQSIPTRLLSVALFVMTLLAGPPACARTPAAEVQDQTQDQTEGALAARRNLPEDPLTLAPVVWSVLEKTIYPVTGSDGRIHLAYELHVANVTSSDVRVRAIEALDAKLGDRVTGASRVVTVKGEDVTAQLRRFTIKPGETTFAKPDYTDRLGPGQSALVYFDITYDNLRNVPRLIKHRFIVTQPKPEGGQVTTRVVGGVTEVSRTEAVVLSPPLKGGGWLNGNGCCDIIDPHRYTILPANGGLKPAERFAIDFVQLDAQGRIFVGDLKELKSYPFYGVEVVSSAPGRVVETVNNLKDEVPGANPTDVTVETAGGNHVIVDIGEGRFILYAHLVPGSVTVAKGDYVQQGQLLGRLGNSGNTDAPHLHFQVMDSPSSLNANGLPFVFDRMQLQGRVVSTWEGMVKAVFAGAAPVMDLRGAGARSGQMPITLDVVGFR